MNTNQFTQKTMEALQAAQRLAIEYSSLIYTTHAADD